MGVEDSLYAKFWGGLRAPPASPVNNPRVRCRAFNLLADNTFGPGLYQGLFIFQPSIPTSGDIPRRLSSGGANRPFVWRMATNYLVITRAAGEWPYQLFGLIPAGSSPVNQMVVWECPGPVLANLSVGILRHFAKPLPRGPGKGLEWLLEIWIACSTSATPRTKEHRRPSSIGPTGIRGAGRVDSGPRILRGSDSQGGRR